MNTNLVAACGLYCGGCDNYLAFRKGHAHLLQEEKFSGEGCGAQQCSGCHSDRLTDHCRSCAIRLCALEKGHRVCSVCEEYPCTKLEEFRAGGFRWAGAAHRRSIYWSLDFYASVGEENWLRLQEQRWRCRCGMPFSFYEKNCASCGAQLDSWAACPSEE